jgi:hypothetical protein
MKRCCAVTLSGKRCKKKTKLFCHIHKKTCSICFEENKPEIKLNCGHSFCNDCTNRWLITNPTCPNCRTNCTPEELILANNYGFTQGLIILVTNYNFKIDYRSFPQFYDYLNDLIYFDEWMSIYDYEDVKSCIEMEPEMLNIYSNHCNLTITFEYVLEENYTGYIPIFVIEGLKTVHRYMFESV